MEAFFQCEKTECCFSATKRIMGSCSTGKQTYYTFNRKNKFDNAFTETMNKLLPSDKDKNDRE
jgi:hypothetical protein